MILPTNHAYLYIVIYSVGAVLADLALMFSGIARLEVIAGPQHLSKILCHLYDF